MARDSDIDSLREEVAGAKVIIRILCDVIRKHTRELQLTVDERRLLARVWEYGFDYRIMNEANGIEALTDKQRRKNKARNS